LLIKQSTTGASLKKKKKDNWQKFATLSQQNSPHPQSLPSIPCSDWAPERKTVKERGRVKESGREIERARERERERS